MAETEQVEGVEVEMREESPNPFNENSDEQEEIDPHHPSTPPTPSENPSPSTPPESPIPIPKSTTPASTYYYAEGLALLRNLKLKDASEYFSIAASKKKNIKEPPETPADLWFWFHNVEVLFWKAVLNEDKVILEEAYRRSDMLEAMAEDIYDNNKEEPKLISMFKKSFFKSEPPISAQQQKHRELMTRESRLVLAELFLANAITLLRAQSYVKGANYLRKSWKAYEELITLSAKSNDPDHIGRVNLGVGFFHLAISLLPPMFLWMVEAIGFKADRERALTELMASRASNCARAEASLLLVTFSRVFLDEPEEEDGIFDELLRHYPTAGVYKLVGAVLESRYGSIDKAMTYLQEAADDAKEAKQLQLAAEYELGHMYFLKCNWEKVIPPTETYLKESKSPNFRAYGGYKLGVSYWMTNQPISKILPIYEEVPKFVRPSFSYDRYALRKTQTFIKHLTFSDFDRSFIPASNLLEAKMYEESLKLLADVPELLEAYSGPERTEDCWGLYYYLMARNSHGLMKNDDSKNFCQKILSMEQFLVEEKWIVPHIYVELAEIFLEEKDKTSSMELYQKAKAFPTPYDFDRVLGYRISTGIGKAK